MEEPAVEAVSEGLLHPLLGLSLLAEKNLLTQTYTDTLTD